MAKVVVVSVRHSLRSAVSRSYQTESGGRRIRPRLISVALATLIAAFLAALTGLPAAASPAAGASVAAGPAGPGRASVAVLDVVMLVDESGSETPAKVADEKQTVATIVQTMLNKRSRVTVVGFGGVNDVTPGQNPIDVACQPTIASGAQNLAYLA